MPIKFYRRFCKTPEFLEKHWARLQEELQREEETRLSSSRRQDSSQNSGREIAEERFHVRGEALSNMSKISFGVVQYSEFLNFEVFCDTRAHATTF